jgi:hypothetical protein
MRFSVISFLIVFTAIFVLPLAPHFSSGQCLGKSVDQSKTIAIFASDEDLVQHAMTNILGQTNKKFGHLYQACCSYKMNGNKPISVTTKAYYASYRKKPNQSTMKFQNNTSDKCNRVVDVIYKRSDKHSVLVVERNVRKKNRQISSKKVQISKTV